jgi:hypothetical protein
MLQLPAEIFVHPGQEAATIILAVELNGSQATNRLRGYRPLSERHAT